MSAARGRSLRRGATIVVALVALLVVPVTAAPALAADVANAVTAAVFNGDLEVFYTGRDQGLWQMAYAPTSGWAIARELPGTAGTVASGPGSEVVPYLGQVYLQVYYENTAGSMTQQSYSPSGWSSVNLGATVTSAPAADAWGPRPEVDVWYRGSSGNLMQKYWTPTTNWSGSSTYPDVNLGGYLTSAPSSDVFRNGTEVDVWVRGGDDGLFQQSWTASAGWSGWVEIGGTNGELASAPAAVVSPDGTQVHVFYAGANGALWDVRYSALTGWAPPVQIPGTAGTVGSAPAAVAYAGNIDVFYLSPDDTGLRQVSSSDGVTWQGPVTPAPPSPAPAPAPPPPATAPATTTIKPTAKRHGSRPRVKAKVMITWRWTDRGTWIKNVKTSQFPPKGRVTVGCSGPACPLTVSAGKHDLGLLWRHLERHRFRRGDMLMIKISEAGHTAERARFLIRHEQIPVLKES